MCLQVFCLAAGLSSFLVAAQGVRSGDVDSLNATLNREIDRSIAYRGTLDELGDKLERTKAAELDRITGYQNQAAVLAGELQSLDDGTRGVDELHERVSAVWLEVGDRALKALEATSRPPDVPVFRSELDPGALDAPAVADRVRQLEALEQDNRTRYDNLLKRVEDNQWEIVDQYAVLVERFNSLRLFALERLPGERREAVLSLSREGIENLRMEIGHVQLSARLYFARSSKALGSLPGRLLDVFMLGEIAWGTLKIVLILWGYSLISGRRAAIGESIKGLARTRSWTDAGWRRMNDVLELSRVLMPWVLYLLTLYALHWALSGIDRPEIDLLFRIAFIYGLYRLSIDLLFHVSLRGVRRHRLQLDAGRSRALLDSIRTVVRVGVGVIILFMVSRSLLGPGHLHHLAVRSTWLILLGAALLLLVRWRRTIADTYLEMRGDKRLAPLVRNSRDRWYGVFVSAGAFLLLAGYALVTLGRDFAMGFDQTRRALAFAFRRRVEKRAQQAGYADTKIEDLPPGLVEAFSDDPVEGDGPVIDHFPGLDQLQSMIEEWRDGDVGGNFLLSGEKGIGKTSWLSRIDGASVPVGYTALTNRMQNVDTLARVLGHSLELPADNGMAGLRKELLSGPKRIEVVDLAQNLFLGKVGGYDTFEAFVSLVEATCSQVFWVCGISAFACDHVFAVRPDLMIFRFHQHLPNWSEEAIRDLIKARMAAGGFEVTFDDLLLTRIAFDGRNDGSQEKQAEEGYLRLLWDHSDGNPRAALHFWIRSLVPQADGRLRVRLFRAPDGAELDKLGNRLRFLLAAIVVHENLTLTEAATVTRYPVAICRLHLDRMKDRGILRRERERYRLTTHWHRTVIRFLKRGNLLSD